MTRRDQRERRACAIMLLKGGVRRHIVARVTGINPKTATGFAKLAGLPRGCGEMRDRAAALDAIRRGVRQAEIARDQGVTIYAIKMLARKSGVHSPRLPIGPRPCISCLDDLPTGFSKPRCDSCDRAHHRHGDCDCGYAVRLSHARCARCGVARPIEALRGSARVDAMAAAAVAEPSISLVEIGRRFGVKDNAVQAALKSRRMQSARRSAVRALETQRQREARAARRAMFKAAARRRTCGCGLRGQHRRACPTRAAAPTQIGAIA